MGERLRDDLRLLVGRYRLEGLLGAGGTAAVWAAERVTDGAPFAVKLTPAGRPAPPSLLRRFEREAHAASSLGGPNVARIEEVGISEDGRPFLVMERLHGQDLAAVLAERGPLPPAFVLDVLEPVAEVLQQAHLRGLVHRDLKPSNLFLHVGPDGREVVKLLDFGSVRSVDAAELTLEGALIGTPQFMAPEQARGRLGHIGPRTDVWAFGMVAVTLLAGGFLWRGRTAAEQFAELLSAPIEPPSRRWPWLGRAFDAWFLTSCARDPEQRFEDLGRQMASLRLALVDGETWFDGPMPDVDLGPVTWSDHVAELPRVENLPVQREAPMGRASERAALEQLLGRPDIGVVTLLGPGGTGKTTLALAVADALRERFGHGVCFVSLAPVRDGRGAWRAIVDALGDAASSSGDDRERALAALRPRHLLLVLDNLEHLRDGAPLVAQLRDACPELAILVTSRSATTVGGEHRFVVGPLEVPRSPPTTPEEALRSPSIALLVRRAVQVRPSFVLRPADVPAACAIVARLDGLPLAIELAASRLRVLTPAELLERLDKRFAVLETAAGDAPERHRTMRATLEWSHDLLGEGPRRVLRQLSGFVGGFTLAAAEAVAEGDVLAGVEALLDQSWLTSVQDADGTRLAMLETVRDYAREQLDAAGERLVVEARWLAWHVRLAERIEEGVRGASSSTWLERADREHPNLRGALDLALRRGDVEVAVRLAGALAWFWYVRGHYREGRVWLDRALLRADTVPAGVRARALAVAGRLALLQCDYQRAQDLCTQAVALFGEAGDAAGAAAATEVLGSILRERGDCAASVAIFEESCDRAFDAGDARGFARATNYVAFASWLAGDGDIARDRVPAALEVFDANGDTEGLVWGRLNLAGAALYGGGSLDEADFECDVALKLARAGAYPEGVAWALDLVGRVRMRRGDVRGAEAAWDEALAIHRELGDLWRASSVLEALAAVDGAHGAWDRCARVLGQAAGLRARIGAPIPAVERPEVEATEARAAQALGASFERVRTAGARPGASAR